MKDVEAIMAVEELIGTSMPMEVWESLRTMKFGESVKKMNRVRAEQA